MTFSTRLRNSSIMVCCNCSTLKVVLQLISFCNQCSPFPSCHTRWRGHKEKAHTRQTTTTQLLLHDYEAELSGRPHLARIFQQDKRHNSTFAIHVPEGRTTRKLNWAPLPGGTDTVGLSCLQKNPKQNKKAHHTTHSPNTAGRIQAMLMSVTF